MQAVFLVTILNPAVIPEPEALNLSTSYTSFEVTSPSL